MEYTSFGMRDPLNWKSSVSSLFRRAKNPGSISQIPGIAPNARSDFIYSCDSHGGDNGVHTFAGGIMLVAVGDRTFSATDALSDITGSAIATPGPGP